MANQGNTDSFQTPTTRLSQTQPNPTQDLMKAIIKPQSQLISIQLDESNYLLWKMQIETIIRDMV